MQRPVELCRHPALCTERLSFLWLPLYADVRGQPVRAYAGQASLYASTKYCVPQERKGVAAHVRMKRRSQLWEAGGALMMIAALCSACASVPYDDIASPALYGIVHRDGKPVEDALVSIEAPRGDACAFTGGMSVRTDRHGRFQFKEHKGLHAFPFARSTSHFQVCIVDGFLKHQGWYERKMRGDNENLTLDCNVQSPVPVFQNTMTGKAMGICRVTRQR